MDTSTTERPETLSAQIAMPADAQALVRRNATILDMVREMFPGEIEASDVANLAARELGQIRTNLKTIDGMEKSVTKPALEIVETVRGWFRGAKQNLRGADEYLAERLSNWDITQRRIAEEARRKAEDEARQARLKQEAEVAVARARAEAEAIEKANAARKAREEAEKSASADAAAKAQQAAIEAEDAANKVDAAAQAEFELSSTPLMVAPMAEQPKVAGIEMRAHWVAERDGDDDSVKQKLVVGMVAIAHIQGVPTIVINRPELLAMLSLDMTAADRKASAEKGVFNVPGMRAVNRPVAAKSRGTR